MFLQIFRVTYHANVVTPTTEVHVGEGQSVPLKVGMSPRLACLLSCLLPFLFLFCK